MDSLGSDHGADKYVNCGTYRNGDHMHKINACLAAARAYSICPKRRTSLNGLPAHEWDLIMHHIT